MITAFQSATDELAVRDLLGDSLFVCGVLVGALVISRLLPVAIRIVLNLLARRSRSGKASFWLARIPRISGETSAVAELRRDQRIRAASLMFSRLVSIVIWLIAVLIILAGLDVDVVWALSSAGFLGAAVAIGGQHSVHDYLNGLHILLEDRFGEGDEIEVTMSGGDIRSGVVERLGTFSTRLSGSGATWHISNRLLAEVSNHSQTSTVIDVGVSLAAPVGATDIEKAVRQALDSVSSQSRATSVILDEVESVQPTKADSHEYRIRARTNAALDTAQHQELARELTEQIENGRK